MEPKKKTGFLQTMRKNTIFAKTFLGMLLLSLAVLIIFYFAINTITVKHQREQIAVSSLGRLRQTAASMELTVEALSQGMTQILWNRDFVKYMVKPVVDQDLSYRIVQQLKNAEEESQLVSRAYFFSPLANKIFQESGSILDREDFRDREMLEAYQTQRQPEMVDGAHTRTAFFSFRGRAFLIQELDIATTIGTLVYELNLNVFQAQLLRMGADEPEILVLAGDGNSVFHQLDAEKLDWEHQSAKAFMTEGNFHTRAPVQVTGYYLYTAPNGWSYLLPLDQSRLQISFTQILTLYLPILLLLLAVGLIFSWYISNTIYTPINRLMTLVAQSGGQRLRAQDEVNFLESVYSNAMEDRAQLQGVMDDIAPEIIESMLENLLVGKSLPEERVGEILAGVGNPIRIQDRVFVIVCVMEPPEGRECNDTEINLHLLAIRNLMGQLSTREYRVYDIRAEKLVVALVCCFPEQMPVGFLTQEYRRIKQTLQFNAEVLPFRLLCERGNIYQSLMGLRYSYREAMEKVQYQQYMQTGSEPEPTIRWETNQKYFQQQAKAIVELTAKDSLVQAQALLTRILDEIGETAGDVSDYKLQVLMLMDEVLERVIVYPLTQEDQELLNCCRVRMESQTLTTEETVVKTAQESYATIFRMAASYSKKSRYKYVEIAKEYLAANYMDSNLSLNKVGDQVGISASYLSELFNEVTGEKFSAYLAAFRVGKARQLLRATKLSIKDIGFRCGFNSIQNFIRVFKKCTEQTPGQYREEVLAQTHSQLPLL